MIKLNRIIQLPLNSIEYSKNVIDITIEADTYKEASDTLDKAFSEQMSKFNTDIEQIQEYGKMLRLTKVMTLLLNWPLWPQIKTEIAKLKASGEIGE